MTYNSMTDANNAIGRLTTFFQAETFPDERQERETEQKPGHHIAVALEGATFIWDSPPPAQQSPQQGNVKTRFWRKQKPAPAVEPQSTTAVSEKAAEGRNEETVFRVLDVNMEIPPGKVVAIVGSIGSGKSSLLQGIVGAMRKEKGQVNVLGSVAYCTQTAWIQVRLLKLTHNRRIIRSSSECHYP